MTTIRRFVCDDLLRFNNVNLDPLTETVRLRSFLRATA
jgi:N-terminal acetyltransferase B complex catalytic subunit